MQRDRPKVPGSIDISVPHRGTVFTSEHGVQRFANAKVTLGGPERFGGRVGEVWEMPGAVLKVISKIMIIT